MRNGTNKFTPGEGGNLPTFTPFTTQANKIGGLYIEKNHKYYSIIFGNNPIYYHSVEMKFTSPSEIGATAYTLQKSEDSGNTWVNTDISTSNDSQDNIVVTNQTAETMYRLLVVGGEKNGYTSNDVTAEMVTKETEFTGWSLDESFSISNTMSPWVGRGLKASFTAKLSDYPSTDTSYTDEHMTYQWYRLNPASYEMTAINGATGLKYITTEEDAGYKLLVKATGDGQNISGCVQVVSQGETVLQNKAYISNTSNTGFTLNLYKGVSSLTADELELRDKDGNIVTITDVSQGANSAIYNISATLDPAKGPFDLTNKSEFWKIASPVSGGHGNEGGDGMLSQYVKVSH